jgi:hypothetical protein
VTHSAKKSRSRIGHLTSASPDVSAFLSRETPGVKFLLLLHIKSSFGTYAYTYFAFPSSFFEVVAESGERWLPFPSEDNFDLSKSRRSGHPSTASKAIQSIPRKVVIIQGKYFFK